MPHNRIPHTQGGPTTRDDATDAGVPMRPLAPGEQPRQGPEDAADIGPHTRGDYTGKGPTQSYTSEAVRSPDKHPQYSTPDAIRLVRQGPRDALEPGE